ncbi:DUF2933 domain-containing protein [Streptomyces canus]|uniref:DUF2933 domain-containing protein n=1 Tax=Streptomyces canus TaxID=58343 RepID=UPI00380F78F9
MCLNKKVLILLAVVAAGLLVMPPSWDLDAIPFLVMLVCPLSMLVMMRDRRTEAGAGGTGTAPQGSDGGTLSAPALDARIRELQAELRELKAEQARRAEKAEEVEETATSYDGSGTVGLDKSAPPAPRS